MLEKSTPAEYLMSVDVALDEQQQSEELTETRMKIDRIRYDRLSDYNYS